MHKTLRNIIEGIKNGELHLGRQTNHYNNASISRFHVYTHVTPVGQWQKGGSWGWDSPHSR